MMTPASNLWTTLIPVTVLLPSLGLAQVDAQGANPAGAPSGPTLHVGSTAPQLDVADWLDVGGKAAVPVTRFRADTVYVLEFWATTCGPCVRGMPHLSELQSHHSGDLRILCITDERLEHVQSFLNRPIPDAKTPFGEQVRHLSIAADPDRSAHRGYMDAADEPGIPVSFIVGRSGLIEWIGHTADIDGPLKSVIEGVWDRDEFAAEYAALKSVRNAYYLGAIDKEFEKARRTLREIRRDSNRPAVERLVNRYLQILDISEVNRAVFDNDERAPILIREHFDDKDSQQAIDWLATVAEAAEQQEFNPGALAAMIELARATAEKTPDSPQLHGALAQLLAKTGQVNEAIAAQESAVTASEAETHRLKRQLRLLRELQAADE